MRRTATTILFFTIAVLLAAGCSDDPAAPDNGEPSPTLQDLVDAASPGDTVLVEPGVYTALHEYTDFIDRTFQVAVVMKPGVVLRGATGNAEDVVIDAQGAGLGIWFHEAGDSTGLADLTVRNALWGVSGYDASPWIHNCILESNGDVEVNPSSSGAGMYFDRCASVITDCVFRDNEATSGGGATFSVSSNVRLERCLFRGNRSTGAGGGLVVGNHSTATLVDCVVSGNTADEKGGGIHCHGDDLDIQGGEVTGNTAGQAGGGIVIDHAIFEPRLEGLTIIDNTAPEAAQGRVGVYSVGVVLRCCETDLAGWTGPVTVDDEGCDR